MKNVFRAGEYQYTVIINDVTKDAFCKNANHVVKALSFVKYVGSWRRDY